MMFCLLCITLGAYETKCIYNTRKNVSIQQNILLSALFLLVCQISYGSFDVDEGNFLVCSGDLIRRVGRRV